MSMTTVTQILSKMSVISVDCSVWSGARRLKPEDLSLGQGGQLPPDDVVSLGSKKLCDREVLKPFLRLREQACRFAPVKAFAFWAAMPWLIHWWTTSAVNWIRCRLIFSNRNRIFWRSMTSTFRNGFPLILTLPMPYGVPCLTCRKSASDLVLIIPSTKSRKLQAGYPESSG